MRIVHRNTLVAAIAALAAAGLVSSVASAQTHQGTRDAYHVTFDDGADGWDFERSNCATLLDDGGNPGAHMNFSRVCDGHGLLTGWFQFSRNVPLELLSNLEGGARISIDFDVNFYDFLNWGWWIEVEEYREVVVELRDLDNPYTDPETGYSWPWTSVWYVMGELPARDAGWKHFSVDIPDLSSDELPAGWRGFGGPEDKYARPHLPPDRTFADVIANVDEIWFTSLNLDMMYSLNFLHDLNVDNIRIEPLAPACNADEATVFVDADGIVRGGALNGQPYSGVLEGTEGDDVIVGTPSNDVIHGLGGNDVLCGMEGDDEIYGGDGMDIINGGTGSDSCIDGEVLSACQ